MARNPTLVEQLTDAIYEASDWAIPPQMVDHCSLAALHVIKSHFAKLAIESKFISDREALLCAVEELDEQLS
jgi:hypothetical protein